MRIRLCASHTRDVSYVFCTKAFSPSLFIRWNHGGDSCISKLARSPLVYIVVAVFISLIVLPLDMFGDKVVFLLRFFYTLDGIF